MMADCLTEEYLYCDFEKYCKLCKYKNLEETKDPCNECLDEPVNYNTDEPVNFECGIEFTDNIIKELTRKNNNPVNNPVNNR